MPNMVCDRSADGPFLSLKVAAVKHGLSTQTMP